MKKLLLSFSLLTVALANAQWTEQATGFTTAFRGIEEIDIIDANTVWGRAYDGSSTTPDNVQEFTRTTDGGATWTPGLIDVGDPALVIGNLTAVDADTAWVSAFDSTAGQGGILQTLDGGATWNVQTTTEFTSATSWCDGVYFFDLNNGLAFGDPATASATTFEVYRTTDGGNTWIPVTTPAITSGDYGYAGSFDVAGNVFWFTTARGKLYRTTDMGVTWTKISTPLSDFGGGLTATNAGRVHFSDVNNGIIIGSQNANATTPTYKLWKTTDGGTTWDAGTTYTAGYRSVSYVPGTTTLVGNGTVSGTSSTAYSLDNGTTWTEVDNGTQRTSIAFLNNNLGWAGGFNTDDVTGGIFKFDGTLGTSSFTQNAIKVYPNPASSIVTISADQLDSYSVKVTDITGKVMMTKEFSNVENTVDVSSFAAGVYFFEINSGSKSQTVKIMKN